MIQVESPHYKNKPDPSVSKSYSNNKERLDHKCDQFKFNSEEERIGDNRSENEF